MMPFQTDLIAGGPQSSITLPHDQRLTIEFVSVECTNSGAATSGTGVSLVTRVGEGGVSHVFAQKFIRSAGGINFYRSSEVVRIYADPGTQVMLREVFDGDQCRLMLSGFLEPV